MEKKELKIAYQLVHQSNDWSEQQKQLISKAVEVAQKAYAPYSNFLVGAAIELSDGSVHVANNQENAAYPSGLCAERVLLFYINANYPNLQIKRMAIVASPKDVRKFDPVTPCGACRQVMAEYQNKYTSDFELILASVDMEKGYVFDHVNGLLPFVFDGDFLKD